MSEVQANCDTICPNQNIKMKFKVNLIKSFKDPKKGIICTCLVKDFLRTVPHVNLGNIEYTLMTLK